MTTSIYEYKQTTISEIEDFINTAGIESYELSEAFRENYKHNPDFNISTWRQYVLDSNDVAGIDKVKEGMFKIINNLAKMKRDKETQEKGKKEKDNNDWWKEYYKENADYWEKSAKWWSSYRNKEHDWQKDDKKRETENKERLEDPKKDDDNWKKKFIGDIEMELIKENISEERLSKRLGASDWKEKINGAADFHEALSRRSNLWDIISKLKNEYTCANCGVKKEEFTFHEVGSKKCCSYECQQELRGKEKGEKPEKGKNDSPSTKYDNFGFSSVSEFFAWMKKLGVNKIEFDLNTNQVVISCNGNKKLNISDSNAGLTSKQQQALTERFKSEKTPITFSEVNNGLNKKNDDKGGNGGIIAAVVIVGIIFTVIIGAVVYNNKKRDY